MKKILLALIIAAVIFTGTVSAATDSSAPPILPAEFFGTVQNSTGVDLPAGTVITASFNGIPFTYELVEDGKIGEPGTFGDKFLVTSYKKEYDDYVEFSVGLIRAEDTVPFESGTSKEIHLVFDIPINDVREVKNTVEGIGGNWSAVTKAEVVYEFGAGSSVYAPKIYHGGKNITIGTDEKDVILVEKKDGNSWITVEDDASINQDGLLVITGDTSEASILRATFTGRFLGDANGDGSVTAGDARYIAMYKGRFFDLGNVDLFYSDVNGDGSVSAGDARFIAMYKGRLLDAHYQPK